MATTVLSERENESWDLGDQRWSRDPATGAFELLGYRQLGTPGAAADPLDWAGLVGARLSHDPADCAGRPLALFPGEFRYSPTTGQPLAAAPHRGTEVWLPPFGGERDGAQRLIPARSGERVGGSGSHGGIGRRNCFQHLRTRSWKCVKRSPANSKQNVPYRSSVAAIGEILKRLVMKDCRIGTSYARTVL